MREHEIFYLSHPPFFRSPRQYMRGHETFHLKYPQRAVCHDSIWGELLLSESLVLGTHQFALSHTIYREDGIDSYKYFQLHPLQIVSPATVYEGHDAYGYHHNKFFKGILLFCLHRDNIWETNFCFREGVIWSLSRQYKRKLYFLNGYVVIFSVFPWQYMKGVVWDFNFHLLKCPLETVYSRRCYEGKRYVLIKLSIAAIVKPVYRTSNYFTEIPLMRPFPDYIIYPRSFSHSIGCKNRGVPSHYCCLYPSRIYMKVHRFRIGAFLMRFLSRIPIFLLFSGHRTANEPEIIYIS